MLSGTTVANRLLEIADGDGDQLTPMQLLKLVYLAHGWTLGLYGRPLIRDEIQAWRYGPVIPNLYDALKSYRSAPVTRPVAAPREEQITLQEKDLIKQIYKLYGKMSGPALSRLTHAPESPWAQVYEEGKFGIPIPNDIIEDHYQRLAADHPNP